MARIIIAIIVTALMLGGCTHNVTELTDQGVLTRTSTANSASITKDGNLQAAYHGIGPMQLQQDADGNWVNIPGPAGLVSFVRGDTKAYILSPNNVKINKVNYDPATGKVAIEGLEANISEPMSQQVAALQIALPILSQMTQAEALATIEKWRTAGTMLPTVADMLIKIVGGL